MHFRLIIPVGVNAFILPGVHSLGSKKTILDLYTKQLLDY